MFELIFNKKKKEEEMKGVLMFALHCELEKIKKWNEETFPDATLGGQLEKLEEEIQEYIKADEEDAKKELADIFIVLGGLRRWESKVGNFQENCLVKEMTIPILTDLLFNINKKMEINKERTKKGVWKKQSNGSYHH